MKKQKDAASPSWSDLPYDILISIIHRLPYIDQIHSRAVCRNWRHTIYGVTKHADQLSWLFAINPLDEHDKICTTSLCYLYDAAYKRKYAIETKFLVGAKLHTSKYGWLLLSKQTKSTFSCYFYCPFTNEVIELPVMEKKNHYNGRATFSLAPTSPDCVVCVVLTPLPKKNRYQKQFFVSTCSLIDKTWNMAQFCGDYGMAIDQAASMEGVFYFTFDDQYTHYRMGVYKPLLQEWKLYQVDILQLSYTYDNFLIESRNNESLLMAYNSRRRGSGDEHWHVFKFDKTKTEWEEVECLGDKMLFLCVTATSIALPAAGAREKNDQEGMELSNTLHETGYNYFFSSGFHGVPITHHKWLHMVPLRLYQSPQFYDWILDEGLWRIWIQPPEIGMRKSQ